MTEPCTAWARRAARVGALGLVLGAVRGASAQGLAEPPQPRSDDPAQAESPEPSPDEPSEAEPSDAEEPAPTRSPPMIAWPGGGAADADAPPGKTGSADAEPGSGSDLSAPRERPGVPDPDAPLPADTERSLPDYDGRDESTTAGEVALWVPRILLSPLYLVSEFVIRRPLGFVATVAEKNKWPAVLIDFFTFGPDRRAGIVPTALIDFGLRPSVGIYVFWDDAFVDDNDLRLRTSYGGPHWFTAALTDRVALSPDHEISVSGAFEQRPDWVFHGIGPESRQEDEARFEKRQVDGSVDYRGRLVQSSWLVASAGVRHADFDASIACCDEVPVVTQAARGRYPLPPRVEGSFTVAYQQARLTLDSRPRRFPDELEKASDYVSPPGSGVRVFFDGLHAIGIPERGTDDVASRDHWVSYGGGVGAFVDLTETQRVVGLSAQADFVDPVGDAPDVPITEQVRLGGRFAMRGGLEGRLVGRSAAVATLSYQWPVWVWMDGEAFYEVGNVFGPHLDGFEPSLLRSSVGLGLRANSSRDNVFRFTLAMLTETFDDGHGFDSFRFVFGTARGF